MSKDLSITMLYDFYGELLTPKQAQAIDLYYNADLSLAEIAEPLEISRQGVRDTIKRGEKLLFTMEERLGLVNRFMNADEKIQEIVKDVVAMRQYASLYLHSKKMSDALSELEEKIKSVTVDL
ncbi:MAG: DNA-binding protein [Ruminococcaceae bacterium]|nr:DNA-binding protein [Oscillospiraceae bacterium]